MQSDSSKNVPRLQPSMKVCDPLGWTLFGSKRKCSLTILAKNKLKINKLVRGSKIIKPLGQQRIEINAFPCFYRYICILTDSGGKLAGSVELIPIPVSCPAVSASSP